MRKIARARGPSTDVLKHIELPLWMSAIGVPIFTVLGARVSHEFFGVPWFLALISLPLIFVLTIICTNSMALTSWTPDRRAGQDHAVHAWALSTAPIRRAT